MKKIIFATIFFTGVNYLLVSPLSALMIASPDEPSLFEEIQQFLSLFVVTSPFFLQVVFAFFFLRLLYRIHISKVISQKKSITWFLTLFALVYLVSFLSILLLFVDDIVGVDFESQSEFFYFFCFLFHFFSQFVFVFFLVRLLYQLHISKTVIKKPITTSSLTVFAALYFLFLGLHIEYLISVMSYNPYFLY